MRRLLMFSIIIILAIPSLIGIGLMSCKVTNNNKINYSKVIKENTQIKIFANYNQINSVSELLDSFKNKPVFIDLWATWCSPCLEEFKYSKPLYNFLTQNGIEIIYVSFDKETEDFLWRKKINENQLSGNHVRASKLLRDNLTTLIWGGIDAYSLPNYLLFDKNKKLVNKDNSSPSTGFKLFKEIEINLK